MVNRAEMNKVAKVVVFLAARMNPLLTLGTIHKRRRLQGGGRRVAKMGIWGDFQGLTEVAGGGRVVRKCKN